MKTIQKMAAQGRLPKRLAKCPVPTCVSFWWAPAQLEGLIDAMWRCDTKSLVNYKPKNYAPLGYGTLTYVGAYLQLPAGIRYILYLPIALPVVAVPFRYPTGNYPCYTHNKPVPHLATLSDVNIIPCYVP